MAVQDAEWNRWRGETSRTIRDHGRQLDSHDRRLESVDREIDDLQRGAAAHRARVGLISGFCAVFGSGVGAALVDLIVRGH